jgi:hypothetical protein
MRSRKSENSRELRPCISEEEVWWLGRCHLSLCACIYVVCVYMRAIRTIDPKWRSSNIVIMEGEGDRSIKPCLTSQSPHVQNKNWKRCLQIFCNATVFWKTLAVPMGEYLSALIDINLYIRERIYPWTLVGIKGTVSRDFRPSVFFFNRLPLGPWLIA